MARKYTYKNVPNGRKIYRMATKMYQMAVKSTKWPLIYPHFPFLGPPRYTQIGTFGMKIYHLATLIAIEQHALTADRITRANSFHFE
jgi:hypothetical protein